MIKRGMKEKIIEVWIRLPRKDFEVALRLRYAYVPANMNGKISS